MQFDIVSRDVILAAVNESKSQLLQSMMNVLKDLPDDKAITLRPDEGEKARGLAISAGRAAKQLDIVIETKLIENKSAVLIWKLITPVNEVQPEISNEALEVKPKGNKKKVVNAVQ